MGCKRERRTSITSRKQTHKVLFRKQRQNRADQRHHLSVTRTVDMYDVAHKQLKATARSPCCRLRRSHASGQDAASCRTPSGLLCSESAVGLQSKGAEHGKGSFCRQVALFTFCVATLIASSTGTLAGKVAIVTGGSSGIGESVARRLAQDGARIAGEALSELALVMSLSFLQSSAASCPELRKRYAWRRRSSHREAVFRKQASGLPAVGASHVGIECDVGSSVSVKAGVEAVEKQLGGVDILVNSAGVCCSSR